jgi:hypothetical protein
MTEDRIAEHMGWNRKSGLPPLLLAQIKRIVAEVQEAEREACATLCDQAGTAMAWSAAADIRERGTP